MNKLQLSLVAVAAAGTLSLTTVAPASADSAASTRNIILGAAALTGLAIEANVAHKNAQANRISGYLPDGATVYVDGHVVERNGYSYYPGNNGQTVSCNGGACDVSGNANLNSNWDNDHSAAGYDASHRNDSGFAGRDDRHWSNGTHDRDRITDDQSDRSNH